MNFSSQGAKLHHIIVQMKLLEYTAGCFSLIYLFSMYARYYAVLAMCVKPPKDILNYDYMLTERGGPRGRSSPLKGKLLIKRRSLFTRALS